jgi:hypothetical protein
MPPKPPVRTVPPKPKKTEVAEPMTLLVYGQSGSGKTSFAAQFPSCGFICDSQERGIHFLARRRLVPQPVWIKFVPVDSDKSWQPFLSLIYEAASDDSIQTLVCESVTGIENICFLHHCREAFGGDFSREGFYNRWQGPKNAARFEWPEFMTALDLVLDAGKNVIVTAHSQAKEEPDPQGVSVLKYSPYSEKDTWARLHRWASMVLFLGKRIEEDKKKQGLKKVAKEDFDRLIFLEGTPYCEAKNWYGLHGVVSLGESPEEGYANFCEALQKG